MVSVSERKGLEGVSYLVRTFREVISVEVTFESAPERWKGDSHLENWGGDSKCNSPEVGMNWYNSGRWIA